jgi:hypothetical protein
MDDLEKFLFIREQFTADLMIDYIDMIYIPVSQNLFIPFSLISRLMKLKT